MTASEYPHPIGGYQLLRRLGSGGSGTVWQAADEGGTQVALKLLHPAVAASEEGRRRLAREARLVNQIKGDGVAKVLDYEADDAAPFIVTEFIDGPTLTQIIKDSPLSVQEASYLARELHQTLTQVHAAGIAHRDLKPSNVIIAERGPVLIDFGIAQAETDDRLTQTGHVTGTPGFVSPELLQAGGSVPFDMWKQGDWWAFAALLVNGMSGEPPFGRGAPELVIHRLFHGEPQLADLPAGLAPVFAAALSSDPLSRPAPEEILDALGRAEQGHTMALPPPKWAPGRTRNPAPNAATPQIQAPPPPPALRPASGTVPFPGPLPMAPAPMPGYVSSPLPRGLGFAAVALSWLSLLPARGGFAGLLVAVGALVLIAAFGAGLAWREKRRTVQGVPKSSDQSVAFLLFPRHLLFGAVQSLPAIMLGLSSAVIGWILASGSLHAGWVSLLEWVGGDPAAGPGPFAVWLLALLSLVLSFVIPSSFDLRLGARKLEQMTFPKVLWAKVAVTAALVALATLLAYLLEQGAVFVS